MVPEPLAGFPPFTYRIHSPSKQIEQVSRILAKVSLVLFTTALLTAAGDAQSKVPGLTGAWRLTEIKRTGSNAETLKNPRGLLVFTGKYWSRMYIDSDQPRTEISPLIHSKSRGARLL